MHPMPREGTETIKEVFGGLRVEMHPMPREGTETVNNFAVFIFDT